MTELILNEIKKNRTKKIILNDKNDPLPCMWDIRNDQHRQTVWIHHSKPFIQNAQRRSDSKRAGETHIIKYEHINKHIKKTRNFNLELHYQAFMWKN